MKSSNAFKTTIQVHLETVAAADPLFAETLKKENKSLDGCVNYILSEVQKSGCNGFADEEIFGMAKHYYDEDDIQEGKKINAQVVVNRSIGLSEEEIKQAKIDARNQVIIDETQRLKKKTAPKKEVQSVQASLF